MKCYSFEETLAVFGGLLVALVASKFFKVGMLPSSVLGLLAAAIVVYLTMVELTFDGTTISHRNLYKENSFPIASVETVSMSTFWGGLPGHTFMFVLRSPPASVNGYFLRTGLVLWPSATRWVDAVNSASLRAKETPGQKQMP